MAFVAEEALATGSRVRAPTIGLTNRAVDQSKVGDSRVLLDDLRVDDRRENDIDALRCARPQHDLHLPTLISSPDALLLAICCAAATTTSSCRGRASGTKASAHLASRARSLRTHCDSAGARGLSPPRSRSRALWPPADMSGNALSLTRTGAHTRPMEPGSQPFSS